jgi:hypothetical protein
VGFSQIDDNAWLLSYIIITASQAPLVANPRLRPSAETVGALPPPLPPSHRLVLDIKRPRLYLHRGVPLPLRHQAHLPGHRSCRTVLLPANTSAHFISPRSSASGCWPAYHTTPRRCLLPCLLRLAQRARRCRLPRPPHRRPLPHLPTASAPPDKLISTSLPPPATSRAAFSTAVGQGGAKRGGEAAVHAIAAVHVLEPRRLSSLGSGSSTVQVAMAMVSLSSDLILITGLTMPKSTIIMIFQRSPMLISYSREAQPWECYNSK